MKCLVGVVLLLLATAALCTASAFADEAKRMKHAREQQHAHMRHVRQLNQYHTDAHSTTSSSTTQDRPYDYYQYYDPGTPTPTRTPRPHPPSSNSSTSQYYESSPSYNAYDNDSSSSSSGDDNRNGLWLSIGMIGIALVAFFGLVALLVLGAASRVFFYFF